MGVRVKRDAGLRLARRMLISKLLDSARISLQASAEGWQELAQEASRRIRLAESTDRLLLPEYRFPRTLRWRRPALVALAVVIAVAIALALSWSPEPAAVIAQPEPVPAAPPIAPPAPVPIPERKLPRIIAKVRTPKVKVERGLKPTRKPKPQPPRRKLIRAGTSL